MSNITRLGVATKKIVSLHSLDKLCIFLLFSILIYELPASVIAGLAASFGLYDVQEFYSLRVKLVAITISVAALNILVNHRYFFRNSFFLLYGFLFLYMYVVIFSNSEMYGFLSAEENESVSAMDFWGPILFKFMLFFLVGIFLPRIRKAVFPFFLATIAALVMVVFFTDFEILSLDRASYVDKSFQGNYLFLGDATAISSLICLALFFSTNKGKIFFSVACILVVFLIGSRTSFILLTVSVFFYFIITFKPKFLLASAIVFTILAVAFSSIDYSELESRNARMFSIFVDYEGDTSVEGRRQLETYGWEDISANILTGNFGGQLTSSLNDTAFLWRGYMHNVFSYWRQFGLIPFAIIVAFAVRFYFMLWRYRNNRKEKAFSLFFLLGTFVALEAVFSRSFAFTYTHLFFGMTVAMSYTLSSAQSERSNYYLNRREKRSRNSSVESDRNRRRFAPSRRRFRF